MDHHPNARADRATLRSPVRLSSGAVRFEAVANTAGSVMRYAWGDEVVDSASLVDPAYLDALRGAQVIMAPELHWPGIDINENGEAIVGVVTVAEFRDGQQVVELTLNRADAIEWVERNMRNPADLQPGVSVRYDVAQMDGNRQMRRTAPNHIHLTLTPRDPTARIRADEATPMTDAEFKAALEAALSPLRGTLSDLSARADAQTAKIDALTAAIPKARADQADPPNARVRSAAVEKVAAAHGVELLASEDLAACESKVLAAVATKGGFRADGLDAATYVVALAQGLGKTAQRADHRDGLNGQRRAEQAAPTHTHNTNADAARAAFAQE